MIANSKRSNRNYENEDETGGRDILDLRYDILKRLLEKSQNTSKIEFLNKLMLDI